MTTKERMLAAINHKEADRIAITDTPWAGTLNRWYNEGMPRNVEWHEYFGIDVFRSMSVDVSPQFERKIIEETDRYIIETTAWGVTRKQFKELDSTPEYIDFKVVTPEAWEKAKARMTVDRSRIDWNYLKNNYDKWIAEGAFIAADLWFGFDITHSGMVGTETLLIAMLEEPEWVADMFNTELDMCIKHFEMILDEGYRFDSIFWPDDMGYKNTPFFSTKIYRELLKPLHTRAVKWAHDHDMYAQLHSCGDIMPLMPDIVETGIDILNPLEVKAGMDALQLKKEYGDKLTFRGGINAQLYDQKDRVIEEIEYYVPKLKENGGYIFSSDHSIPNSTSLDTMKAIVETVKRVGAY